MSASLQDFIAGLDPTGYTSVSGAELLQMLQAATPYTDKGQIITTTDVGGVADVPDATTNVKWTKYLWKRITANSVVLYVWNDLGSTDFSGPGFQKWYTVNSASIASGSITNSMLAGLITSDKISGLDWSKLSGVPALLSNTTQFAGDVQGTYNGNYIGADKVVPGMISPLTGAKLVQRVFVTSSAWAGTNLVIPLDDTPPQITGEGLAYLNIAITPKALNNYLRISVNVPVSHSKTNGACIVAGFVNAVANSIGAKVVHVPTINTQSSVSFEIIALVSDLIAALGVTTISTRYGTPDGPTDYMYVNGNNTNRLLGGTMISTLVVEEYRV